MSDGDGTLTIAAAHTRNSKRGRESPFTSQVPLDPSAGRPLTASTRPRVPRPETPALSELLDRPNRQIGDGEGARSVETGESLFDVSSPCSPLVRQSPVAAGGLGRGGQKLC